MRILASICAFMLFLFLGVSVPALSQDKPDKQDKVDHPAQAQDDKARDNKGQDEQHKNKTMKHDDKDIRQSEGKPQAKPDDRSPDLRKNDDKHPAATRPQEPSRPEQRADQQSDRDRHQHPMEAQRGKRIPDDRFRASFGREHHFHVDRTRIVNQSQPVIVYSGYSFQLVDAWPADWSYDDDCYIDYVDGEYFLFDVFHPGVRIAVFVTG